MKSPPGAAKPLADRPTQKHSSWAVAEGTNQDVWIYDPRRDAMTRLTFGGVNRMPQWTPDSQYVVYLNFIQGIFEARADGGSAPQALTGANQQHPISVRRNPEILI